MLEKIFICLLFFIGQLNHIFPQTELARLDIGRREPLPDYFEFSPSDDGLVTFGPMSSKSSRYLGITKYDSSFAKQWSKQVVEQNGKNKVDFIAVVGENILIFVSENFSKEGTKRTYYSLYDLDGIELAKNVLLSEVPDVKEHKSELTYSLSLNKKKLLCYKNLENTKDYEEISYFVFGEEGEVEAKGDLSIPYPDEKFEIRNVVISNSGMVYLLGKLFPQGRIQDPDDYSFHLITFDPSEKDYKDIEVPTNGNYITDLSMKVDRRDNIFLAGFFSESGPTGIIGTMYCRVNENLEITVNSTQKFGEDFLSRFLSERQIDRGKELGYFYLDNIILRSDGGVLLIAEKFYTSYNSYIDIYGYWVDQKIYHYDDILVNSVAADGSLEWSASVPKLQSSDIRDYLSYSGIVSGSNLHLIYGYQPKKEIQTIYFNSVDMDGLVAERKTLLENPGGGEVFLPRESAQISNSEALLIYFQPRARIYTFLKISFD